MARRTNAQLDADKLREAASIMQAYGVPASANVLTVVADSIEEGRRKKTK
ncbi:hypothetical protein MINTM005_12950 [Mycobacterium intracellulare]|nr:hypothetical protein [Mycobacterium intracellulare]BCO56051.1 hypothetical protein MINTM005_12950 [Mycobacterium intracellulare]